MNILPVLCLLIQVNILNAAAVGPPVPSNGYFNALATKCSTFNSSVLHASMSKQGMLEKCTNWTGIEQTKNLTGDTEDNARCLLYFDSLVSFCTELKTANISPVKLSDVLVPDLKNYKVDNFCKNLILFPIPKKFEHDISRLITNERICEKVCTTYESTIFTECSLAYYFASFNVTTLAHQDQTNAAGEALDGAQHKLLNAAHFPKLAASADGNPQVGPPVHAPQEDKLQGGASQGNVLPDGASGTNRDPKIFNPSLHSGNSDKSSPNENHPKNENGKLESGSKSLLAAAPAAEQVAAPAAEQVAAPAAEQVAAPAADQVAASGTGGIEAPPPNNAATLLVKDGAAAAPLVQGGAASPDKNAPASPDKNAPASPDKNAPASPDKNAPASPDKNAPASPDKNAPASPDKNAAASPDKNAAAPLAADAAADRKKDNSEAHANDLETNIEDNEQNHLEPNLEQTDVNEEGDAPEEDDTNANDGNERIENNEGKANAELVGDGEDETGNDKIQNKVVGDNDKNAIENPNTFDSPAINGNTEDLNGDSYFFSYFMVVCVLFILGYVGYHNRQKVLALVLEGKRGKRQYRGRRPNSANYHKLDSNLEEAISSTCTKNSSHVIY